MLSLCHPAQQAVTNATGMEPSMPPTKPASASNSHRSQPASSEGSAGGKQQSSSSNGDGGAANAQNDVLSAVTSLLQQSQQVRNRDILRDRTLCMLLGIALRNCSLVFLLVWFVRL